MQSFLTTVMTSHGYLGLIILAFIEACCIPISSEIVFAFAGLTAALHPDKFSLIAVILIGTAAEMGGSLTSYAIGRRGGRPLLERYGKYVLVTRSDLDRAERFFSNRGSWAVAVARVLPLVRCFASFAAGVVEVPAWPFAIFSLIGTAVWATVLSVLGYNVGSAVEKYYHPFTVIGAILLVVLLAGLILHRVYHLRKEAREDAANGAHAAHAEQTGQADQAPQAGQSGPTAGSAGNGRPKVSTGRTGGAHRSGRPPSA